MAHNVILPQWGMEMSDGTILRWLKREGDSVTEGESLAQIETAKINSDLEAPASGVVARLLFEEGATVDVGTVIAIIAAPGEKLEILLPESPSPLASGMAIREAPVKPLQSGEVSSQVEPRARRLAKEKKVDLSAVVGTGSRGRITVEDVTAVIMGSLTAVPKHLATTVLEGSVELTGMRRTIAERMLKSSLETASLTLTREVDVTPMVEAIKIHRDKGARPLPIIIMAVTESLKEHPVLNSKLSGMHVRQTVDINVGVAVALGEGLVVPVIKDTSSKDLLQVAEAVQEMASKARQEKLSYDDVSGGTFTVSNLGPEGVDAFTPIINQPEVAILGVGRTVVKPVIHDNAITKRSMMWLSLTFDHRMVDGAPAARFLGAVAHRLEDVSWLGLE
jgi:pyruvate dehydrogenase E2 component (dihydrolipoamide acetyltransferase)